jgi:Cu-Zn family superoxide dismutase
MKRSFVRFSARSTFVMTLCALVAPAYAAKSLKVTMNLITTDGVGKSVGTITLKEGKDGVTLEPKLKDLPPGEHGFHVHENPSCDPADKGDLPKLVVSDKGEAKDKMEVKGVTLADFQGHALMIHAGGDNYSDAPKPLGGGGERIACGVAK